MVAPSSQPVQLERIEFIAFGVTQADKYDQIILTASREWGLDPFMLKGLLYVESGFDPTIVNKTSGAAGIAQFTGGGRSAVRNLRKRRGVKNPNFTLEHAKDPSKAIPAAAEILSHLIDLYGRDGSLAAYVSGPSGGRAVSRRGLWVMGKRVRWYVLEVIKQCNRLRTEAGLPPVPGPKRPYERHEQRVCKTGAGPLAVGWMLRVPAFAHS